MKLLGAHMSIAGGVDRAVERGARAGCQAIQIFTKSSNQWRAREIPREEIRRFRSGLESAGISAVVAHASYLINLASPDPALYGRSIEAFGAELDRCEMLGIPCLVVHPGSHKGAGERAGIERIAKGLDGLLRARRRQKVTVLLETTAGQGHCVGHRFEHLGKIMAAMRSARRVGVCVDTCHVFAAGYDIRSPGGYGAVIDDLDGAVGLDRVKAFHLNDSKKELHCRVDRHEHIGKGFIGVGAFRLLMNDPRFEDVPMVLETPKGADDAEDRENLALLRSLVGPSRGRRRSAG